MIPFEAQKKNNIVISEEEKLLREETSHKNKLKYTLDNICVICGRIPKLDENLNITMLSPWHCIYCNCPKCGGPSTEIKLVDTMFLKCKCGWEMSICSNT